MSRLAVVWMLVLLGVAGARAQEPSLVPIDECQSLEASQTIWEFAGAVAELSDRHATGGGKSLKLTIPPEGGAMVLRAARKDSPQDWSGYRSVGFDITNDQDEVLCLVMRIDDAEAEGFKDRFEPCDAQYLPPRRTTHVEVDLTRLLANNARWLDPSRIVHFNLHVSKGAAPRVLYVDSFRFVPLAPQDRPVATPLAEAPRLLDDGADAARSERLWKDSSAKLEWAAAPAGVSGKVLKAAIAPKGSARLSAGEAPLDWRGFRSLCLDVHNPSDRNASLTVRIDDAGTVDSGSRFTVDDVALPAGKTTPVRLNIHRMISRCGRPMDMARITAVSLEFAAEADSTVLEITGLRVDPARGGLRNELRPGRIPGQTAETLGRALLEDPQIKPLVPVFRAMPPSRLAICSHSASMSIHWSTSGAFFDIAAEAVRAVNPQVEYKGFHKGGMGAQAAVAEFLTPMQDYKPTDVYFLVVPRPLDAQQKLMETMKAAGARVFVFDAVKPWGAYPPALQEQLRALCRDQGATFVELLARGYGAPGSYRWCTTDGIHMTTEGHLFYARELLKEWGRIYAPAAGAPASSPGPQRP